MASGGGTVLLVAGGDSSSGPSPTVGKRSNWASMPCGLVLRAGPEAGVVSAFPHLTSALPGGHLARE